MTVEQLRSGEIPPALDAREEARLAIGYLLARIATTPDLAWRFIATESHAKLVRAYAALTERSEANVREQFKPLDSYCCRACQRAEEEGRAA